MHLSLIPELLAHASISYPSTLSTCIHLVKFSNKLRLIYNLSAPILLMYLVYIRWFHLRNFQSNMRQLIRRYRTSSACVRMLCCPRLTFLLRSSFSRYCLPSGSGIVPSGEVYIIFLLRTFGSKCSPWLFDTFAQALNWILMHVRKSSTKMITSSSKVLNMPLPINGNSWQFFLHLTSQSQ